MQMVRLGRTGLDVSVAGLGCGGHSRLGMARGKDVRHAADMVRRALDLGVNFIDTARAYGTEEAVGMGVKGRRDEAVISSKAGIGRGDQLVSAADMARYVDDCLKKLDTTYVDVFHLHGVTPAQYPHARDVMVPELKRQQAAGKLRFLAISEQFGGDTGHVMFRQCLADDLFDVVMVGFNILNPSARQRVFPVTREKHVGTLIMFAVREALSRPDELKKVVGQLIERGEIDAGAVDAADPLGFLGDAQAVVEDAYRFCRHEPGADVILTGTGDPEHLKANLAAIQQPPLPPEVLTRLDAIFGRVDSVSGN
jgi:aryl-alcohol dehydrogenase-like predicted oxidoreductase